MNRPRNWIAVLALAATASATTMAGLGEGWTGSMASLGEGWTGSMASLGEGWTTDFAAAAASAAESKHDLILDFTGSDW